VWPGEKLYWLNLNTALKYEEKKIFVYHVQILIFIEDIRYSSRKNLDPEPMFCALWDHKHFTQGIPLRLTGLCLPEEERCTGDTSGRSR
jgi:hypothetical protein